MQHSGVPNHSLSRVVPGSGYIATALILALGYTALRDNLNIEFHGATWEELYQLEAGLPFGSRILVPLLARPLVAAGLDIKQAFLVWEVVSTSLLLIGLRALFCCFLEKRWATVASIAFLFTLPLAYLLKFKWPVFYPYDTLSLAFMAWGLYLLHTSRWIALLILVGAATLNRESSILLVALFMLWGADRLPWRQFLEISTALLIVFFSQRWIITYLTLDNPRPYHGQMPFLREDQWRVNGNIDWLSNYQNLFILLASMGFLPLFYLVLFRHIPAEIRRYHTVVVLYFCMLIFVGNLYEPRIFGEIMLLLFVPIGLACATYLDSNILYVEELASKESESTLMSSQLLTYLNRLMLVLALPAVYAGYRMLNELGVDYFYP